MTSMNRKQLVKVPKDFVEKMWKCQICSKIITKPMSIPECLHIFCPKCIRGKITKEGLKRCPICSTELGCAPLDRLRIDHNMTSIWKKLIDPKDLPEKIEEGKEEECDVVEEETRRVLPEPTFPLPSKKKERSLSSLVKSPKYSNQNVGRTKSGTKARSSRGPSLSIDEPAEKMAKQPERVSFLLALPNMRQSENQSSKGKAPMKVQGKSAAPAEGIMDLRKLMNPPAERASESKPQKKFSLEGSSSRAEQKGASEEEIIRSKGKGKMIEKAPVLVDEEEEDESREFRTPPVPEQPCRMRRGRPRKPTVSSEEGVSAKGKCVDKGKGVVDSAAGDCESRMAPIWLTLLASDNQEGRAPLPQIPSCYLRIKDVNLTISFLKKYIVQKLVLDSEDEVEISLWGQPLPSSTKLHSLIGMWLQIGPTLDKVKTRVGASAEDFVMVLCYGRKSLPY